MNEQITERARPATYQDVLDAPPHMVAELIAGALHLHPRPRPRHARAASSVLGELYPFDRGVGGPGGWSILIEPELHLGDDVLVPDVAGWRNERLPRLPETAWFETPPDWVCEVLSPSTRRLDAGQKRALYGRHGVGFLWHVDPDAQLLEVFESVDGVWRLVSTLEGDAVARVPPFAERPIDLGKLWRDAG